MLSENNPFIIPWNDLRCSATDCLWKAEKALVMAGVYNRRRGGRDIPVAIKIFINRSLSTATFAEEAMKEAHIMMQAEGSHVTKVYGLACGMLTEPMLKALGNHMGTCPDTVVTAIVMELVPGGSLEALLSSPDRIHSPLTMEVKVRLLLDIATGLTNLHEKNIVHGDLKPQNILMVVDGRSKLTAVRSFLDPLLKLSDFGLSRQVKSLNDFQKSSMEQTKTVYGTLMYLAPEILQQQQSGMYRRASRSTDIYAFGILMHYILSEKKPFESIHSVLSSIVNGYRPHSDELPKDTPATVIDLMHRCWSPDRTTRPTAVECFSILRQLNETLRGDHFDIFFSHPWVNKPFLCHVYKLLVREGYRVWYDQQRMRHDMGESMREGIEKSTVVMACINELYESRKNCMFELEVAKQCNKPIVSVFIEPDFCDKASVTLQNLCEFGPDHPQGKMFTTALADIAVLDWETDDGPSSALMQKLRESLKDVVGLLSKSDCLPSLQDHFGTNASAAYEASQDLSHVSNSTTIDPQLVLQDNIRTTDLINSLVACFPDMEVSRATSYGIKFYQELDLTSMKRLIKEVGSQTDGTQWLIDNGVDQLDADDIVELSNSIDNWANFTDCVEACTTLASNSPSSRGRAHDSDDFLTHCCPDIEPTHAAHYCEDLKRSWNIHTAERMVKVITKRRSLWSDIIKDDSIHRLDVDDINEFVSKVQAVMDEEHLTLRIAIDRTITDSVTTLPANTPDSISWLADYLCDMHPEKAAEYGKTLSDLNIHTMRRLVRCIMNISLRASLRRKWLREEVGMHKYDADDLLSYCVRNADFETLVEVGHNTTANPETQLNYALSFLHMDPVKRQDLVKRFKEKNIHTINRLVRQILLAKESAVQWLQTEFLLDMQSAEEMVRYVGGLGLTLPMTVVTASISCVPVKSLAPHRSQSLNNNMPPIPAQTEWDLDFSSLSFKNGGTLFPHGGKLLGYENETLDVPMKAKCTLNAPLLTNPCVKSASTAMARDLLAQPQLAKQLKQLAKNFLSEKGSEQINAKDSPVDKSIDNSIDSLKEMFKFNSSTCAVGAKAAKKLSPNQNLSFSLKLAGNDADIEHQSSAAVSLQNLHVSSALQPIEEDGDREDQGSAAVSLVTEDPNDFADGRNSTTVNDMRGSEVPWFELYPY